MAVLCQTSFDPERDTAVEVSVPFPTADELYKEYGGASDGIDREEFHAMLENLDGFSEVNDAVSAEQMRERIAVYVDTEFTKADLNHDGVIDRDEFMLYYFSDICFKFPVGKNGFNPGAALYNIFCNYCSFGKGGRRCEEMESHQLLKLCKECGLQDERRCRKADIDLVFHRARAERVYARQSGATKLQYEQFLHALMLVAEKRQTGFCDVVRRVQRYGINRRDPSIADFLVMRDPAGTYVDARDLERPRGLPKLRRTFAGADAQLARKCVAAFGSAAATAPAQSAQGMTLQPSAAQGIGTVPAAQRRSSLEGTSQSTQSHGKSASFAEVQQPYVAPNLRGKWNPGSSSLAVARLPGTGTICDDIAAAEDEAAEIPDDDVVLSAAADDPAPVSAERPGRAPAQQANMPRSGRQKWLFAQMASLFYEDAANKRIKDIHQNPAQASLLHRDGHSAGAQQNVGLQVGAARGGSSKWRRAGRNAVLNDSEAMQRVRDAEETQLTMALKHAFEEYNRWGGGVNRSRMHKPRFQKVFRDVKLVREGGLSCGELDKIFFKIKPESQPSINFVQFMEGLRHVALVKRMALNDIIHRIVAVGGPVDE